MYGRPCLGAAIVLLLLTVGTTFAAIWTTGEVSDRLGGSALLLFVLTLGVGGLAAFLIDENR